MGSVGPRSLCIAVAFDKRYLVPALVALVSAARELAGTELELLAVTDMGPADLGRLRKLQRREGLEIRVVRPSSRVANASHLPHLSPMTNARLDMQAWGIESKELLYLDADTLTCRRPALPSSIPEGCAFGATVDAYIPNHKALCELRPDLCATDLFSADPEIAYFNAGVLFVDVDGWISKDVGGRALRAMNEFPTLSDQDALNLVAGNQVFLMAPKLNAQTPFRLGPLNASVPYSQEALHQAREDPHIVHFTGDKPWRSPRVSRETLAWLDTLLLNVSEPSFNAWWLTRELMSRGLGR